MILRLLLVLGPVACLPAAAEKRAIEFRDVIELNEPSQPRISPDGARVVFMLSRASVAANSTRRSLWVASDRTAGRVLLDEPVIGPVEWASDSASVIVRLTRPGKAAFWRVSVNDGKAAPVFEHENPIVSAWWSPDRSQVLFTSAPGISAEERQRPAREGVLYDESVHGIRSFTRGSWSRPVKAGLWRWRNGMRNPEAVVTGLDSAGTINAIVWSPDGERAAVEYTPAQAGLNATNIGLLRIPRDPSGKVTFQPLVTSGTANRGVQWRPDGRSFVFAQTGEPGRYYVPRSTIRSAEPDSEREAPIPGNGPWFYLSRLDIDGRGDVLAEYDDWSRSTLYRVPWAGGPATPVYRGEQHLSSFHLSRDRKLAACIAQSFTRPPEVAILNVETGSLKTLTDLNPQVRQIQIQPAIEKRFRNRYGHETNGFLVLPPDFKGKPVPLVMIQYAFSNKFTAQAQWITSYPVQHLAAAGIAVLLHNYPRELGWTPGDFEGAAVSQAYNPLASMEAAVGDLAQEGIVDPRRAGIAGWSFGAWLAELAITQTKLFHAASAGEGGLNNAGQYWVTGSAQMQQYLDAFFGGPPFGEAYANYRKLSPGLNAHRVSAPLLREYGSDVGVQSLEFYMALRRLGKLVEQFIYPGAPHVFDLPSHRMASMQRNMDWFRFWLQDYEDPDPGKGAQYRRWRAMRGSMK